MTEHRQGAPVVAALPHQKFWGIILAGFLLVCIIFLSGISTIVSSLNIIAPGVSIEGVKVGGKSPEQASALLAEKATTPLELPVELTLGDSLIATSSATLGMKLDIDGAVSQAMSVGRGPRPFDNAVKIVDTFLVGKDIPIGVVYDQGAVKSWAEELAKQYNTTGEFASVALTTPGKAGTLVVKPGTLDRSIDVEGLASSITNQRSLPPQRVAIPVTERQPLSVEQQALVKARAEKLVGKSLEFSVDDQDYLLDDKKLITFLALPTGYNTGEIEKEVGVWKVNVTRDPQEPQITVEGSKESPKVTAFTPPLYGRTIDEAAAAKIIEEKLVELETVSPLTEMQSSIPKDETPTAIPITRVDPKNSLGSLNELGLKERIGFSESYFAHSIPNRVHNVALTGSRINLTLIPPDAVFSFNNAVGEVSGATGYKQAYIIQAGRTVLGDGGGVCQVSTTVFRSALNAGLPIVNRRGHSYRVSYYEQNSPPGLDATVISPSVDFKFKNDTPGYILVTTKVDPEDYHMSVEMWGTSDGRKAELSEFKLWDQVPARPTVYQEDPTLPVGTTKQVDWSAPGAKASFRYTVTRSDKTIIDETYKSVYQPWAAVYLVGTAGR